MVSSKNITYIAKKEEPSKEKKTDPKKTQYVASSKKSSDQTSSSKIPQVRVILPWYVRFLFMGIWTFIVIVIVMMWNALNLFRTFRDWWNKNGGKKYNKVFSINLLAQYQNFSLGYFLWSLFTPVPAKIQSNGIAQFLINTISAYALLGPDDDKDTYFMMPSQMCENIAVGTLDHGPLGSGKGKDPAPDVDWDWAETDGQVNNGWPVSVVSWQKLLHLWGVPLNKDESVTDDSQKKWQQDGNQNFLWHNYKLPLQTPFILAFMWNLAEDPDQSGTKWYEQAFLSAVGLNNTTSQEVGYYGGWWGMVKYGFGTEKDLSYAEINRILYSRQEYIPPASQNSCNAAGRGIGYSSAVASGIMAAAGILAFLPSGGTSTALLAGAGVSGLLTAGTSALQTAQKCKDIK